MKNWMYIVISAIGGIILGSVITFLIIKTSFKGTYLTNKSFKIYPSKVSEVNNWVLKINDYAISKEEFEDGYKIFQKQLMEYSKPGDLPDENTIKREYLNNMLNQYVLLIKALDEGIINNKETEFLIQSYISRIYVNNNMTKDSNKFNPTKLEIDQFLRQYKSQLEQSGLPQDKIVEYVRQQLYQNKLQMWYMDFIKQIKDQYKIERNNDYLIKKGFMESTPGLPPLKLNN